ncbi:MAG: type II toxin-antitoxin system HicA family toxin [Lachnospiraceae bacterium]
MKVSELEKKLKKHGCKLIQHGSSHDEWYSKVSGKTFMIPRHKSNELATGTANKILKDAGLK